MDPQLSPTTGDYTGERISTLANAVYLRLATPLGSWWADTSLGSRLHELKRQKAVPRVELLARQYAQQALQPLLDDGRASSISITSELTNDADAATSRLILLVEITDASGQVQHFSHPVQVA